MWFPKPWYYVTLCLCTQLFLVDRVVAQERRTALVIGNSTYRNVPLRNPVNDARAMASTLGRLGFTVTKLEDASKARMAEAIQDFGEAIKGGGVGLFYFAGHGIQADGENFLIPVDADIQDMSQVKAQGVYVGSVLHAINHAKSGLHLVILDACRNNPFSKDVSRGLITVGQADAPGRTGGSGGLAAITAKGLTNTLIAFATEPNEVAADGAGQNGVYTENLLRNLTEPGLRVEQVFKRTRLAVRLETDGRQVPWESTSLEKELYFVPPSSSTTPSSDTVRQPTAPLREQQAALQTNRSARGSTMSAPNRSRFSFSAEAEKERASQAAQDDAIRARLQTPCPGARRQEPLVIDITEESRVHGLLTTERSSRFAKLLEQNLQQAGLAARLASSRDRSHGRYSIQGIVSSEEGSNRLVSLNEANLSAELALRDRNGRIITMVEISGEDWAGQNSSNAVRALSKEQANDAASQLYSAFCGSSS